MIILVSFVALVLTVATFSRALSHEVIGLPIRAWAEKHPGPIHTLVTCHWCNSFWISLAVCTLAGILTSLWMNNWWALAPVPFVFPAVRYAAAWVIDRTVT